jgi:hypothetical protein
VKKGERRGVACRNHRMKRGQNRADEINQEIRIDLGSPVMVWTWSIAKPGPVNRDRLVVRGEALLKWAHFTPGRNRTQRGQQQNWRPLAGSVKPKFDPRTIVMPR